MTELPRIFADCDSLREAFVDGLERMLAEHHNLGVFILVLAAAMSSCFFIQCIVQSVQHQLSDVVKKPQGIGTVLQPYIQLFIQEIREMGNGNGMFPEFLPVQFLGFGPTGKCLQDCEAQCYPCEFTHPEDHHSLP